MTTELPIFGKNSQPKEPDGVDLDFMRLPEAMATYAMPKISRPDSQQLDAAKDILKSVLDALSHYSPTQNVIFNTQELDAVNIAFINELLDEGEVSIIYQDEPYPLQIQESILAGVWRVQCLNPQGELLKDYIEVGEIPALIKDQSFKGAVNKISIDMNALPEGIMNAPPLIAELNAHRAAYQPDSPAHVINLSLLPQTEQDLAFLTKQLGTGHVTILSRGYGTNRMSSTATDKIWWVQFFNSDDTLILNTLEVCAVPAIACAALEDIQDSAKRLQEILDVYLCFDPHSTASVE